MGIVGAVERRRIERQVTVGAAQRKIIGAESAVAELDTPPDPLGLGMAKAKLVARMQPDTGPEDLIRLLAKDRITYRQAADWMADVAKWRGRVSDGAAVVEESIKASLPTAPATIADAAAAVGVPAHEEILGRLRAHGRRRDQMIRYSIAELPEPDGVNHPAFAAHDKNELASLRIEAELAGAVGSGDTTNIAVCVLPIMPDGTMPLAGKRYNLYRGNSDADD